MSGKDGSTWRHEWVPVNAAAKRLKEGSYPGKRSTGSRTPLKQSAPATKERKRYYVVRSLGGHTFQVGDNRTGGVVRRTILTRSEAEKIARHMNRAGGYAT